MKWRISLKANDIARVQDYLRRTFGTENLFVDPPQKAGQPAEIRVGDEFLGSLYRDDEDGEVSYSFTMTILEMELPPASPVAR